MADSYVCSGAIMRCTMGTSTAKLTVLPTRTVYLTGKPMANISDHLTMKNLAPFGRCRSLGFPATASATAAHHGHLTPMPCMHNTPFPWENGKMDYIVKGYPALLKSCTCPCMWGGTISLITNGQAAVSTQGMLKKSPKRNTDISSSLEDFIGSGSALRSGSNSSADNQAPDQADQVEFVSEVNLGQLIDSANASGSTAKNNPIPDLGAWIRSMSLDERRAFVDAFNQLPRNPNETTVDRIAHVARLFADAPSSFSTLQKLAFAKNCILLENSLGITKGNRMSISEADKQSANPKYTAKNVLDANGNIVQNPNYDRQYSINCATCSAAYALRLMGFDVKAKGNTSGTLNEWLSNAHSFDIWNNPDGTKATPTKTQDWMTNNNITTMTASDYRRFFNETCSEQGVYIITLQWSTGGGHATILQRDSNGALYYIEPQVYGGGTIDGRRSIDDLLLNADGSLKLSANPVDSKGIMRVDDKLFNPDYANLFDT